MNWLRKANKKIIILILAQVFLFYRMQGYCLPEGLQIESGNVQVETPDANTMNITASDKAVINFDTFNIGTKEAVHFIQPNNESSVLNRVTGSQASQINGTLTANGVLFLTNFNGINFGPTVNVQVNSMIASTLDISTNNFISGNYVFDKNSNSVFAKILNEGTLEGNNIALVGSAVENRGIITARVGTVNLAAGNKTTVSIDAMGLIQVEVTEAVSGKVYGENGIAIKDAIANSGTIESAQVYMSAKTVDAIFERAVNTSGIVKATCLVEKDGVIKIVANKDIEVSGKMEVPVNSPESQIDVVTDENIFVDAKLETKGNTRLAAGKNIRVNADITTENGSLELIADRDLDGIGSFKQSQSAFIVTVDGDITIQSSGESLIGNIVSAGDLILKQGGLPAVYTQWFDSKITTAGSFRINRGVTIKANDGIYNIARDWVNLGMFEPGSSTVNLVSTETALVMGENTFYNFSVNVAEKIVKFESEQTQEIRGVLTLRGEYGKLLVLGSTEPGKQWKINPQGETDIAYVLAGDSINIRGPPLKALHSSNNGNLINWDLDPYWVGAGADEYWSTGANWDTGTAPTSSDAVTFDGTAHAVPGAVPNKNATIDASFQGTIVSLTINGYTGTITQARPLTISGAYSQSTGTFTGASQAISVGTNFTLSGGTFTSTSGTLSVAGNWTHTDGTFTHNSGTVTFNGSGTQVISYGVDPFYNVTYSGSGTLQLDPSWSYQQKITISYLMVANTNQTDFPVLVKIQDENNPLFTTAQADGDDIVFTLSDGTKLSHEIEVFTTTAGSRVLWAWVKIPTLSASSDTVVYMHYGNASCASQQNASAVWDSNYKGVWHLPNGTTLSVLDSTSNDQDGTTFGSVSSSSSGQIDGAASFAGTAGNYISTNTTFSSLTTTLTISCWVKPGSSQVTYADIFGNHWVDGGGYETGIIMQQSGDSLNLFSWGYGTGTTWNVSNTVQLATNTWQYVTAVKTATQIIFYLNGTNQTSSNYTDDVYPSSINFKFGEGHTDGGRDFNGVLDECRVSNSSRSADWITTEYRNQSAPATYETAASQEAGAIKITGAFTTSGTNTVDNATNNPSLDIVGAVTVASGTTYTKGTGSIYLTGGAANIDFEDKTIEDLVINASAAKTLTDGLITDSLTVTAGTLTVGANPVAVSGDVLVNGGTLDASNASSDLDVNGNVTVSSGTLSAPAAADDTSFTVAGNWEVSGTGIFTPNSGRVLFDAGATGKTIVTTSSGADDFYDVKFNNAAGGWTLSDNLEASNDWTIGAGAVSAGSTTITVGGSWDSSTGTFAYGTSTVDLTGTGNLKTYGQSSTGRFYNVHLGAAGKTTTLLSHISFSEVMTIGAGVVTGGYEITLYNTGSATPFVIDVSADITGVSQFDLVSQRDINLPGHTYPSIDWNPSGNKIMTLTGDITCISLLVEAQSSSVGTLDMNGHNINCSALSVSTSSVRQGILRNNSGSVSTLTVSGDLRIYVGGGSSNLNATNMNINLGGNWRNDTASAGFTCSTTTVTFNATTTGKTIIPGADSFYNVVFNGSGGGWTETTNNMTVTNNITITNGTFDLAALDLTVNGNLLINGGTLTASNTSCDLDINGNVTVSSGTLSAPAVADDTSFTVAGNWEISGTGIFTPNAGRVLFDAAATGKTIVTTSSGADDFYDVKFNNAAGGWTASDALETTNLTMVAGTFSGGAVAITCAGNFTLSGGTFTSTSGTLSVAGNWTHTDGTFTHNSGTVVFNGSGTQVISYGVDPFYNVTYSGSGTLQLDPSWSYQQKITISYSMVANTNQTDFPVLVKIQDENNPLFTTAQADGDDIVFTGADGTKLSHEIELFTTTAGSRVLWAWVKIPTLSASSDTVVYMHYDNASCASQQNAAGVWSSSYAGVWHLPNGTTLSALDSTNNNNDGTITGATAGAGQIDGAGSFDGNDYVDVGNGSSLISSTATRTISSWIYVTAGEGSFRAVVSTTNSSSGAHFQIHSGNQMQVYFYGPAKEAYSTTLFNAANYNTWYYVTGVWDGTYARMYVNGTQEGTSTAGSGSVAAATTDIFIGKGYSDGRLFYGQIDETRISSTARSADWITTEYRNQSAPATYETAASQEAGAIKITGAFTTSGTNTVDNATNNPSLDIVGAVTIASGTTYTKGTGNIYLTGGAANIDFEDKTIEDLIINASAAKTLTDGLTTDSLTVQAGTLSSGANNVIVSGNVVISGGTLTAPSTTLTVGGNWLHTAGTFTHNSGTVDFNGSGTQDLCYGSDAFYNLTHSGTGTLYVWPYRKAVTIDRTKVTGTQTDFPVLLYINADTDLYARAQSDGDDLVFIGADGTRLAHEIEYYSRGGSSDTTYIWVKIPTLLSSANTVFYMNYGNANCSSQQNAAGVWDSNYAGVWHLPNGTTLSALDSTSNDNDGTITGATAGTGQINGAGSFDGDGDYVDCGANVSLANNSAVTYSVWIKFSVSQTSKTIMGKHNDATGGAGIGIDDNSANKIKFHLNSYATQRVNSTGTLNDNLFHQVVGVWDGDVLRLYIDGSLNVSSDISNTLTYPSLDFQIGRWVGGSSQYFNGSIDEARVSSTARSASWIATEYANQNSPATFLSIGSQAANTLTIANNLTQSGSGTMNAADASLAIAGNISVSNGTLNASSANCNLDVAGNVIVTAGTLSAPAVADDTSFTVAGNWEVSGTGIFTPNSGRVVFDAAATGKTIVTTSSGADDFYDLKFNNAAGGWTASDALETTNLTITAGAFTAPSTTLTIAGNFANSGTFTHNSGTVTFNGTAAQTITGATTWYNLTINNSYASPDDTYDVDPSVIQTVAGTLTVTDGQWTPSTGDDYNNVSIGANGIMKPDASASITVSGDWANAGAFTPNSGTVTFDAASTGKTITAGGSSFYNLTFNGAGGAWALQDTNVTVSNNFTLSAGTLTACSGTLSVGGNWSHTDGTWTHNSGAVDFTKASGTQIVTFGIDPFYNLTHSGAGTLQLAAAWVYMKQITIDKSTTADPSKTDFPALVYLVTDAGLAAGAQADGDDIAFTDANGNRLYHEIKAYTSSTGYLYAWVRVPTLSITTDTVIYMHYGNASCSSQQNATATWTGTYVAADTVVGQADFISNLANQGGSVAANTISDNYGIYSDGTRLFVADSNNHRVLIYNTIPTTNNAQADVVIGQPDFTSYSANQGGSVGANTLYLPTTVYSDGTRLFIADDLNNRVLIYNTIPTSNNASADVVVGQVNFTSNAGNQGGSRGANTLYQPIGVYSLGTKLFIAEAVNNRVLIFNTIPTANNASADVVVGQANFTSGSANQGGSPAANTLYFPYGVSSDGTKLIIAENNNHRVLIYNTIPISNNASADVVIGQANFTTNSINQGGSVGANTLYNPQNLYFDGKRLYISEWSNHRVLVYNTIPIANNTSADVIIGQADFISNAINRGGSPDANTIKTARGIYSDGERLYIDDGGNNRALIYNISGSVFTLGSESAGSVTIANNLLNSDGTFDANSKGMMVAGNWTNSATFTPNSNTVSFISTSTGKTINPGASSFYNVVFNGSGGGWTETTNNMAVTNNLTGTAGTFNLAALDLAVTGNLLINGGTLDADNTSCDLDINGNVTVSSGTLSAPAAADDTSFTVAGNWEVSGAGIFTPNAGRVVFDAGATGKTIVTTSSGSDDFYDVKFNNAAGGWTASDALETTNFTITAGAFTAPATTLTIAGNFSNAGTFTHNSGTVQFNGTAAQTITGATTWYNLTINNSYASPDDTYDVDPSAVQTVAGTLTVTDGQWTPYTGDDYNDVSIGANGIIKPDASAAITVSGNYANAGAFTHNSGTVTFDATATGKTINPGASSFYNVVFNGIGGGWTETTNNMTVSNNLTLMAGTFDLAALDLALTGNLLINGGTLDADNASSDLDINGNVTVSSGTLSAPAVADDTSFTVAGNWEVSGTGVFTPNSGRVVFDAGTTGKTIVTTSSGADDFYDLKFNNAAGGWTASDSLETTNLAITAGAFTAPAATLTIAGNFANAGTFTHNSGTVTFNGAVD